MHAEKTKGQHHPAPTGGNASGGHLTQAAGEPALQCACGCVACGCVAFGCVARGCVARRFKTKAE